MAVIININKLIITAMLAPIRIYTPVKIFPIRPANRRAGGHRVAHSTGRPPLCAVSCDDPRGLRPSRCEVDVHFRAKWPP